MSTGPGEELAAALAQELAAVGRKAVAQGLVVGSGGNLSARLPGTDAFVVTAADTWLDELGPDGFSVLDLDGRRLAGNPRPSSEWRLHAASYLARPDAGALIHLHPQFAVLLDALGHEIRCLTTDHVAYVDRVARVPYLACGTEELAAAGAAALAAADCVVLAHHGCSVVAPDVPAAFRRALNLEEAARLTYYALLLGDTSTVCPPAYREHLGRARPGRH